MGAGQKKYPPKDFLAIFPQTTKKKLNKKYTLFYTQNYKKNSPTSTNLYAILSTIML